MTTVKRGLDDILGGGTDWITFEDGKPMTLLFIDWFEDLIGIREHYEPTLNPKYVRCPGKEVCPLCAVLPADKYPALRIKFRVYDPTDKKVKFVSLAKTHIKSVNKDLNLDEINPTKQYVRIIRSGKGATDTSYSARLSKEEIAMPDFENMDIPDIEAQVTPHTPDQIRGFMNAITQGGQADQGQTSYGQTDTGAGTGTGTAPAEGTAPQNTAPQGGGRKLPF